MKIKDWVVIIGVLALTASISFIAVYFDERVRPHPINSEEYLVPTEVYRPPIIRLPFVKYKLPVPFETLPIHPQNVDKTITISTLGETPVEATLVVDHKGNIYTTTNFPEDVEVKVTKWKRKVFELGYQLGYAFTLSNGTYHCLSVDFVRLYDFYLGCEIGAHVENEMLTDVLIGASLKYRIATLEVIKTKTTIKALAGWNFINNKIYLGVSLGW